MKRFARRRLRFYEYLTITDQHGREHLVNCRIVLEELTPKRFSPEGLRIVSCLGFVGDRDRELLDRLTGVVQSRLCRRYGQLEALLKAKREK